MRHITKIKVLFKQQNGKKYVPQTFHQSCVDLLTFAQCLGLFPLSEIRDAEPKKLKFKWLSFKMLYSAVLFVLILLCSATSIYKAFSSDTVFYALGELIVFIPSALFRLHPHIIMDLIFCFCNKSSTDYCSKVLDGYIF